MKLPEAAQLPTLNDCVHCGLCLPACPTYRVTGREAQSPRGRIAALRGLVEKRIHPSRAIRQSLEDCLVCRACESSCPSGISMEAMMASFRSTTRPQTADLRTRLEQWWLEHVVAHPRRLDAFMRIAAWGAPIARRLGWEVPRSARLRGRRKTFEPIPAVGERKGRALLLRGCINDHWFQQESQAAARVLARNGWEVMQPPSGCCGALHVHGGCENTAELLRTAIQRTASNSQADVLVVDSTGCAASLMGKLDLPVTDTLSLLATRGWHKPSRPLSESWVYAPPCHQTHGPALVDGSRPEVHTRALLGRFLEGNLIELPGKDLCCGAAGTYALRRPEFSQAIAEAARERFIASSGSGIVTGNPGCLLRWEWILGDSVPVSHPVSILDRAYENAESPPGQPN